MIAARLRPAQEAGPKTPGLTAIFNAANAFPPTLATQTPDDGQQSVLGRQNRRQAVNSATGVDGG